MKLVLLLIAELLPTSLARPVYELLGARDNVRFLNHRQGHRYPAEAQAAAEELLDRYLKAKR